MTDDPTHEHEDLLRAALHAEADGIEASAPLLDRTLAAAARPPVRPARRLLVAAAVVAAVAVGAGVAVALDDGDREVDAIDDPTTTTTEAVDPGKVLRALFPCEAGDVMRLSVLIDGDARRVVDALMKDEATAPDSIDEAPTGRVAAALGIDPGAAGTGDGPSAVSATFDSAESELAVRSTISDIPGVTAVSTTDCTGAPVDPVDDAPRPTTVALVREDGWLVVIDLETGVERELYFHGDPTVGPPVEEGGPYFVDAVDLSPDGQWVYFSTCCEPASGNTYRISIDGGEPELIAVGAYPRVSPDGRFLATGAADHLIVTFLDREGVASVQLECCISGLAWSPDGRQLAFVSGNGAEGAAAQVLLFDWDGTSLSPADTGKPDNPGSVVSWTPEGTLTISSGGPVDDDRGLSQDTSYQWILWIDEEGVVREPAGFESSDRTPIEGLPEALAADW